MFLSISEVMFFVKHVSHGENGQNVQGKDENINLVKNMISITNTKERIEIVKKKFLTATNFFF